MMILAPSFSRAAEEIMPNEKTDGEENVTKVSKKKSELLRENRDLKKELDSLRAELVRYRSELQQADSLDYEIIEDIYDENENKSAAGLNPEDYSAEVSDRHLVYAAENKRIHTG